MVSLSSSCAATAWAAMSSARVKSLIWEMLLSGDSHTKRNVVMVNATPETGVSRQPAAIPGPVLQVCRVPAHETHPYVRDGTRGRLALIQTLEWSLGAAAAIAFSLYLGLSVM